MCIHFFLSPFIQREWKERKERMSIHFHATIPSNCAHNEHCVERDAVQFVSEIKFNDSNAEQTAFKTPIRFVLDARIRLIVIKRNMTPDAGRKVHALSNSEYTYGRCSAPTAQNRSSEIKVKW